MKAFWNETIWLVHENCFFNFDKRSFWIHQNTSRDPYIKSLFVQKLIALAYNIFKKIIVVKTSWKRMVLPKLLRKIVMKVLWSRGLEKTYVKHIFWR